MTDRPTPHPFDGWPFVPLDSDQAQDIAARFIAIGLLAGTCLGAMITILAACAGRMAGWW